MVIFGGFSRRMIVGLVTILCGVGLSARVGLAATATEVGHHPIAPPGINPHLHVPAPTPGKDVKPAHVTLITRVHRAWHPLWDARAYIALHRGTGTVRGFVSNGKGQPLAGARVALHKPAGRVFARVGYRHITYTSSNGEFVMTNVRPGDYRVYAYVDNDKKKGFSQLVVNSGATANVKVKI